MKPLINNVKPLFDNSPLPSLASLHPPTHVRTKTVETRSWVKHVLQTFLHLIFSSLYCEKWPCGGGNPFLSEKLFWVGKYFLISPTPDTLLHLLLSPPLSSVAKDVSPWSVSLKTPWTSFRTQHRHSLFLKLPWEVQAGSRSPFLCFQSVSTKAQHWGNWLLSDCFPHVSLQRSGTVFSQPAFTLFLAL